MKTTVIAQELMNRNLISDMESATKYANQWTTENTVKLDGKEIEVLWYIEESDTPNEMMYYIEEKRFLDDEELESVIY